MSVSLTQPTVCRTVAVPAHPPAPVRSARSAGWSFWWPSARPALRSGGRRAAPAATTPVGADQPQPSQYAPAADLVEQAEYDIGRLSQALASEKDFDKDLQKRSKNDVHTLSAIVLVLAKHDQPNKLQSASLLPAVRHLGEVIGDYARRTRR